MTMRHADALNSDAQLLFFFYCLYHTDPRYKGRGSFDCGKGPILFRTTGQPRVAIAPIISKGCQETQGTGVYTAYCGIRSHNLAKCNHFADSMLITICYNADVNLYTSLYARVTAEGHSAFSIRKHTTHIQNRPEPVQELQDKKELHYTYFLYNIGRLYF